MRQVFNDPIDEFQSPPAESSVQVAVCVIGIFRIFSFELNVDPRWLMNTSTSTFRNSFAIKLLVSKSLGSSCPCHLFLNEYMQQLIRRRVLIQL